MKNFNIHPRVQPVQIVLKCHNEMSIDVDGESNTDQWQNQIPLLILTQLFSM